MTRRAAVGALAAWGLLVVASRVWGAATVARTPTLHVNAAPFVGTWSPAWRGAAAIHLMVAAAAIIAALLAARRDVTWSVAAAMTWAFAAALAWTSTLVDGSGAWWKPMATRYEYLRAVPRLRRLGVGAFLNSYVDWLAGSPTHVKSHPPGMVLLLGGLDLLGLGGPRWAAALVIVAGTSAAALAIMTMRELSSAPLAPAGALLIGMTPAAIWMATSADGLFAAVAAAAVYLGVRATRRSETGSAVACGLVTGAALFLTYAASLLVVLGAALLLWRGRWRVLGWAVGSVAVITVLFLAAGFNWWQGFLAARRFYGDGVGGRRPFGYFAVGNLAVFAVAVGPAAALGLVALWNRRGDWTAAHWLAGVGLLCVALADLSGLSKGEVERIWLPFVPWVAVAATALPRRLVPSAALLQVSVTVGLAVGLRSPW